MKQNDTINYVFLILCILLLGFVFLTNKMSEEATLNKESASRKIELNSSTE